MVRFPSPFKLSLLGLLLSIYAVYVEHKTSHRGDDEEAFSALCDISSIGASCSSVFALPEGHLVSYFGLVPPGHWLDIPNALIGCVYYTYRLLGDFIFPVALTQFAASCALTASLYLAYQLTILQELCLLCWTTHVLNLVLWVDAIFRLRKNTRARNSSKAKHG